MKFGLRLVKALAIYFLFYLAKLQLLGTNCKKKYL